MKQLLLFLSILFSFISYAQSNSINYKALIKDDLGNIVANDLIQVQFTILQGVGQTNVYTEIHTPTTDANGLVVLNIGEGTLISGDYTTIDWSADDSFLNVQVNIGSGLVDLGTTAFKSIPYALQAQKAILAQTAENVSGLEKLDEGNGIGYRLIDKDSAQYGNIGLHAIDLSYSSLSNSQIYGATGNYATAIGSSVEASGDYSTVFGRGSEASAENAIAAGFNARATGDSSIAMGTLTHAPGDSSVAIGGGSRAFGDNAVAMGSASASGDYAFSAIKGQADGEYAVAMGNDAEANGNNAIALGDRAIADEDDAVAIGSQAQATRSDAVAIGFLAQATGFYAVAIGDSVDATGSNSVAIGETSTASGRNAISIGFSTEAESYASVAIGANNVGGGNPTNWLGADPLFEIGNSASNTNSSNALTVLKNGTITAPSFSTTEIITAGDKALITKEYADSNYDNSSGLEAIDEGNGIGWRLKGIDPLNYGNVGSGSIDLSYSGSNSTNHGATGTISFASGASTTASGGNSTAMGTITLASGSSSTALGNNTEASGVGSIAMGGSTKASGSFTSSLGLQTKAEAYGSTAIGRYNIGGGNAFSWVETDPLFEIGNGNTDTNRDNAITVLKNGKVGIGEHQPDAFLEIKANNNSTEPTVKLVHEGTSGARINFTNTGVTNGNRWTLYGDPDDVDANSIFTIAHANIGTVFRLQGNGRVGIGSTTPSYRLDVRGEEAGNYAAQVYNTSTDANADGLKIRLGRTSAPISSNSFVAFFDGNNTSRGRIQGNGTGVTYATTSDRRLKTNITDIKDAMALIGKIQPRLYEYKTNRGVNEYGFIAQELQPLYAQAVTGSPNSNAEKDPMMVDYGRLTPLLTAGIKELAEKIESLETENSLLKQKLNKLEKLEARLSALETSSNSSELILIDKK